MRLERVGPLLIPAKPRSWTTNPTWDSTSKYSPYHATTSSIVFGSILFLLSDQLRQQRGVHDVIALLRGHTLDEGDHIRPD